ncbi:hypothetical protein [Lacticaseibacillus suihuaensis]
MVKRKPQKPAWYAEYDRLFVKPRPQKRRPINRATLAILLLVALSPLAYHYWPRLTLNVELARHRLAAKSASTAVTYRNNYALKAAGLRRTAAIDQSRNLVAKRSGHTVAFSTGDQLTVNPSFNIEEYSRDHVVTPTRTPDSPDITVAGCSGRRDQTYVQADLRLYANLIGDFNAYADAATPNLVKVFKTQTIGRVQTGYVFDVPGPKDDQDYARLTRYFLFPDGTGAVLKTLPDMTKRMKKLTKASSLKQFATACGASFTSLAEDYAFEAAPEP